MNTLDELLDSAAADLRSAVEQVRIAAGFPDEIMNTRSGHGFNSATKSQRLLVVVAVVVLVVGGLVLLEARVTDTPTAIPSQATTSTTPTTTTPLIVQPIGGDLFDFSIHKGDFFMVLDVAQWNRSLECMSAHGHTLPTLYTPPTPYVLLYGLPEGADPSRGFRISPPDIDSSVAPRLTSPPPLTTEQHIALNGPNDSESRTISLPSGEAGVTLMGGCMGESQRALFGSEESFFEAMTLFFTLQDEDVRMMQGLDSSPEVRALNGEWAACMSNAGFQFNSPLQAWSSEWPEETTAEEIAAATADVDCKTATDYTNRADAAGHETAASVAQSIKDLLARWNELSADVIARAMEFVPSAAEPGEPQPPAYLGRLTAFSDSDAAVITETRERLVANCMADRDYSYNPSAVEPSGPTPDEVLYPSPDLLAEFGYGWRSHLTIADDTTASTAVAYSDSTPGLASCGELADAQMDFSAYREASQVLTDADSREIEASVMSDERTLSVSSNWSICMNDQGYAFETWGDAERSTYSDGIDSPSALALAKVDYGCRQEFQVAETELHVRRQYVAAWRESHSDELHDLEVAKADLVGRATAILATLEG